MSRSELHSPRDRRCPACVSSVYRAIFQKGGAYRTMKGRDGLHFRRRSPSLSMTTYSHGEGRCQEVKEERTLTESRFYGINIYILRLCTKLCMKPLTSVKQSMQLNKFKFRATASSLSVETGRGTSRLPPGSTGKIAPRNSKWGRKVGNDLATTTATERSPAGAANAPGKG